MTEEGLLPHSQMVESTFWLSPYPISHFSAFEHDGNNVTFNGQVIAIASHMEKDTCTDSYWRGGKKYLTLNSNSRSNCRGCAFCGTYSLEDDDKALTNSEALRRKADMLQVESGALLSELE